MYAEVDVFISNYTLVDPEIYQLWIEGFSSSEAVTLLKQKETMMVDIPIELITSDVLDHYRTYSLLERVLYTPTKLSEQPSFQLEPQSRSLLIEKYYSLDDSVARELFGKKFSSRNRKDLDEVAEKTGVRLKSCRRQFDNVKRIFKAMEELPGNTANNIKQQFILPDELADKYAIIVFIACLRFETTKRKLQYLNFSDFFNCAQAIRSNWTYKYQHAGPEYYDTEMDKEFLLDLREIRYLLDKEKEIKCLVTMRLKSTILERIYQEIDSNFRSYWRSIITIACSLHRTREMRQLFLDLTERLIEPWKANNWSKDHVGQFMKCLTQSVLDLEVPRDNQDIRCLWDRYMQVITACLLTMYHN
ncbi:acidic fibroblast growth factor intracellular-binding protein [Topomyia yanbarensis]|uniref:acidic fibroblast growth factor intracellular-binding protein n=1 Tax=Topomyia yanbarensis TaxID=2498891 RepID=UPI00273C1973|nr:acidic fibroblast growth factor intracellular-binding protein [Topomyia yanbarensis]